MTAEDTAPAEDGVQPGVRVDGGGDVSEEELAAIVGAVQVVMGQAAEQAPAPPVTRWRFSGRWWSKPVPMRRSRPW